MERSNIPTPRDQPALRIEAKRCGLSVIQRDAQRVVIGAVDPLPAGEINAMTALTQLMQTEKLARKFNPVSQCGGRFRRLFLGSGSFAFPLPAAVSVGR